MKAARLLCDDSGYRGEAAELQQARGEFFVRITDERIWLNKSPIANHWEIPKIQIPSTKSQKNPISKFQMTNKLQIPITPLFGTMIGSLNLEIIWDLGFDFWNLSGIWHLIFGI